MVMLEVEFLEEVHSLSFEEAYLTDPVIADLKRRIDLTEVNEKYRENGRPLSILKKAYTLERDRFRFQTTTPEGMQGQWYKHVFADSFPNGTSIRYEYTFGNGEWAARKLSNNSGDTITYQGSSAEELLVFFRQSENTEKTLYSLSAIIDSLDA